MLGFSVSVPLRFQNVEKSKVILCKNDDKYVGKIKDGGMEKTNNKEENDDVFHEGGAFEKKGSENIVLKEEDQKLILLIREKIERERKEEEKKKVQSVEKDVVDKSGSLNLSFQNDSHKNAHTKANSNEMLSSTSPFSSTASPSPFSPPSPILSSPSPFCSDLSTPSQVVLETRPCVQGDKLVVSVSKNRHCSYPSVLSELPQRNIEAGFSLNKKQYISEKKNFNSLCNNLHNNIEKSEKKIFSHNDLYSNEKEESDVMKKKKGRVQTIHPQQHSQLMMGPSSQPHFTAIQPAIKKRNHDKNENVSKGCPSSAYICEKDYNRKIFQKSHPVKTSRVRIIRVPDPDFVFLQQNHEEISSLNESSQMVVYHVKKKTK
jgi:hypothetical protein